MNKVKSKDESDGGLGIMVGCVEGVVRGGFLGVGEVGIYYVIGGSRLDRSS